MNAVEIDQLSLKYKLPYRLIHLTDPSQVAVAALYQQCGFSFVSVDVGFFRKHYKKTVFENRIKCRHMIRKSMDLKK